MNTKKVLLYQINLIKIIKMNLKLMENFRYYIQNEKDKNNKNKKDIEISFKIEK